MRLPGRLISATNPNLDPLSDGDDDHCDRHYLQPLRTFSSLPSSALITLARKALSCHHSPSFSLHGITDAQFLPHLRQQDHHQQLFGAPRERTRADSGLFAFSRSPLAVSSAHSTTPPFQRLPTLQRNHRSCHRPPYPEAPAPDTANDPPQRPAGARRRIEATGPLGSRQPILPPPFRNRAAESNPDYRFPRRIGRPGRLWNPTNSTPREPSRVSQPRPTRQRRPSTPPPPPVPVAQPTIDITSYPNDPERPGTGNHPLLALPEQARNLHPPSARASLQIEGRLSQDRKISLPGSVRHSYDTKRSSHPPPEDSVEAGPSKLKFKDENPIVDALRKRGQSVTKRARAISFGLVNPESAENSPKINKGKGKAVMLPNSTDDPDRGVSKDLERGPDVLGHHHNGSTASLPDGIGIGSAISSSNSSIMGDPDQPDLGEEWGPQHPCFPHMNPHVPLNSLEYTTTRIIRVRRDWLVEGDLAPTFSNLYPEILDPAGVSEQEFRRVIEKLNGELVPIFNPYYWRNILDGILGVLTGWVWDDLGLTNTKSRLRSVEGWIEKWNAEMEKTVGSDENSIPPRIIPLRRTGYMNLDIQISDPEVSISTSEPVSRSGPNMPDEPEAAVLADSTRAA
ncbi:Golgin subfamily A member 7/ERF4 family-domain-containing protein [Xylariaceae sp. FL0016]|nr:Golgin subfamily A member 7/ERF4 family-domain-containing protein [Xylariaceae sp. FL0016]